MSRSVANAALATDLLIVACDILASPSNSEKDSDAQKTKLPDSGATLIKLHTSAAFSLGRVPGLRTVTHSPDFGCVRVKVDSRNTLESF